MIKREIRNEYNSGREEIGNSDQLQKPGSIKAHNGFAN